MLTEREEEIFQSLLDSAPDTFKGKLYRDGVPRPDIYLAQQVRAVFVFREPNLRDDPYELDMRAQIRDPEFRAMRHGEYRKPATRRGWWNWKVGCLAHAVVGALAGRSPEQGFTQFDALIRKG